MASAPRTQSMLEEHRTSAALLLALLGQTAMRRLRDAHTAHHLSPRQFQLLGLLHDQGTTGQQELGQVMGVDPSVLVTLLNPLEADGYVSRQRDPADRRRHPPGRRRPRPTRRRRRALLRPRPRPARTAPSVAAGASGQCPTRPCFFVLPAGRSRPVLV